MLALPAFTVPVRLSTPLPEQLIEAKLSVSVVIAVMPSHESVLIAALLAIFSPTVAFAADATVINSETRARTV